MGDDTLKGTSQAGKKDGGMTQDNPMRTGTTALMLPQRIQLQECLGNVGPGTHIQRITTGCVTL